METKSYYQAFIFDMDGTIVSTLEDITDAVNYSLTYHHFPLVSYEEAKGYLGNGSVKLIERSMHHDHMEIFQSVFDVYYQYYKEHYCIKTRPYEGLIPALEYAKEKGVLLFVYTNKPEKIALEILSYCFPKGMFTKLVGVPLGGKTKPDPEPFFDSTKEYHLDYGKVAYFGDSVTDIETATNLHAKTICSVLWGFQSKEKLSSFSLKPTCYLSSPMEIRNIVDRGN